MKENPVIFYWLKGRVQATLLNENESGIKSICHYILNNEIQTYNKKVYQKNMFNRQVARLTNSRNGAFVLISFIINTMIDYDSQLIGLHIFAKKEELIASSIIVWLRYLLFYVQYYCFIDRRIHDHGIS